MLAIESQPVNCIFKFYLTASTVKIKVTTMAEMVTFHGIPLPRGMDITEEKVAVFPRLPAKEDDIFIASYPRSGSFNIFFKYVYDATFSA